MKRAVDPVLNRIMVAKLLVHSNIAALEIRHRSYLHFIGLHLYKVIEQKVGLSIRYFIFFALPEHLTKHSINSIFMVLLVHFTNRVFMQRNLVVFSYFAPVLVFDLPCLVYE